MRSNEAASREAMYVRKEREGGPRENGIEGSKREETMEGGQKYLFLQGKKEEEERTME